MVTQTENQIKEEPFLAAEKKNLDDEDYIREYLNLILLGFVFCVLVSVLTYNPADPSSFNLSSSSFQEYRQVSNTFGLLGASVADWLFQVFGFGALLFSAVFLAQLLNTFRLPKQKSRFFLRLFGYPQLIVLYLGLISCIKPVSHFRGIDILTGGVLGDALSLFCQRHIGAQGTLIALSVGVVASMTLCLGIRPLSTVFSLLSFLPFGIARNFLKTVKDAGLAKDSPGPEKPALFPEDLVTVAPAEENTTVAQDTEPGSLLSLLTSYKTDAKSKNHDKEQHALHTEAVAIEEKLATFGIKGTIVKSQVGPVIHTHEFEPALGVKVNKILSLQDDLCLALKAYSLSISLQPGKSTLGIEIPARIRETVSLKEVMESSQFQNSQGLLCVALGKYADGSPLVADLALMPHVLIAGATGSGKSVCMNIMLLSLMMSKTPDELRFVLIDPKMLELSQYDGIGHLLMPVVTGPEQAAKALGWVVDEMERRYALMKSVQVRNIQAYNNAFEKGELRKFATGEKLHVKPLPYIVVVVDELSDLMMTAAKEVEDFVQRLAQKARAAGIHLILATQRPSVDVLTGVIKANLPCRLSFQVASRHDSRTIIETIGAERLLGRGDMLFLPPGVSKILRAQCAFVTDEEVLAVADALRRLYPAAQTKTAKK